PADRRPRRRGSRRPRRPLPGLRGAQEVRARRRGRPRGRDQGAGQARGRGHGRDGAAEGDGAVAGRLVSLAGRLPQTEATSFSEGRCRGPSREDLHMRHVAKTAAAGSLLLILGGAGGVLAQDSAKPDPKASFFVTSVGSGKGPDLGGLAGADSHCADLAKAAGITGKTWKAYLSTSGPGGVNAKDRIGKGPWYNVRGVEVAASVADLHSANNKLNKQNSLTEKGGTVNGIGDMPNTHDMLTGTNDMGTLA